MATYHDAPGMTEMPGFSGLRVRLLAGASSMWTPHPSSLRRHGKALQTQLVPVEDHGPEESTWTLLSGVLHGYMPHVLAREGVTDASATDGHALVREVLSLLAGPGRVRVRARQRAVRAPPPPSPPRPSLPSLPPHPPCRVLPLTPR